MPPNQSCSSRFDELEVPPAVASEGPGLSFP